MVATDLRKRRKQWATASAAKLRRAYRRDAAHVTAPEPATTEDREQYRRAIAVPQTEPTPREMLICKMFPAMVGVCIREPLLRNRTQSHPKSPDVSDAAEWATAACEGVADWLRDYPIEVVRWFCARLYHGASLSVLIEELAGMVDEVEDDEPLPEDPREHYRAALSEWGRSRHLRKIHRLTGTYPMDTGDMSTGEVYSWYLELHDAVAKWRGA